MNLSTRLGDAGDVPVSKVPVPRSVEAVVLRFVPAGRRRNHIPGVSYLFGEPGSGIPFFVTVSKTLNYCHLDVQVSIKLCKDNRRALGGRFDFVQSFGEETGALPKFHSVQCFSVFFPPWHTLKMVPSLWHSGVSGQGSSASSQAEGLSLTHLFCTQIRRPLRGCKIEPHGTARPQGKLRKSSSEGPWLAQVGSIPGPRSCCCLLIDKHHRGAWDHDPLLEDTRMFWSQLFSPAKRASVPSTKKMEGYSVPLVISLFFSGIRKRK